MSVTLQLPYVKYTAAAAATTFATGFWVIASSDLQVSVNYVIVTSGFTLSGLNSPSGLDVIFTSPMVGGEIVELQRIVATTRATDYQQLGDFLSPVVNTDFDRIVMMVQDMNYRFNLADALRPGGFPTVRDFGAIADGVVDDRRAISLADADGKLNFGAGVHRVSSSITLSSNAYFYPGASLSIDAGVVVTFDGYIESTRQKIFSGAGTVLLNGERSHSVYPEWWGAFADSPSIDADVPLQAMSDAVVSGREVHIDFDTGTWYLAAGVSWSRACRIIGVGKRLVHFRCKAAFSAGDVFTVSEQGVSFEEIQFSSVTTRTSGAYINASGYNYMVARGIWFTDGYGGVNVAGNVCTVEDVTGFNWSSAAGSYIVNLEDGYNTAGVDNIEYIDTGSNRPKFLVRVGAHTLFQIDNLLGRGVDDVLGFVPASGTCGRGHVGSVIGQSGVNNSVHVNPTGTAILEHIDFDDVYSDQPTGSGLLVKKESSDICKHLHFKSVRVRSPSGTGVKVSATSGRVDHFTISGGFVSNGAGDGYDITNAYYWSITNTQTSTCAGTGTIIGNTCVGFNYSHNQNNFNTTANLTDSSGAVTKVVADNLVA